MTILKAAAVYFSIVFGCGFALGFVRVLFIVPLLGVRLAELFEMPIMLFVIVMTARWMVGREAACRKKRWWLVVGVLALGLMLSAELLFGMWLQGKTVMQVLLEKDSVSGSAFYSSLVVFAVMPALMARGVSPKARWRT